MFRTDLGCLPDTILPHCSFVRSFLSPESSVRGVHHKRIGTLGCYHLGCGGREGRGGREGGREGETAFISWSSILYIKYENNDINHRISVHNEL